MRRSILPGFYSRGDVRFVEGLEQSVDSAGLVSLKELKQLALKHLGARSPLRRLILAQPDELPRSVALSKMADFSVLLEQELREQ